ncbi:crossover junction endonuclease MUS81 isoform X2 [Andrographis paniculata]|uniref:crossover junction endonuclease MUS81 isoform X2 n=1 Tax=Andrographis paniculata TaxID=175694 RepID=UPI0021E97CBD|nr:crossover junction endonuclease MUS81 isoform X2 [Andrographis paniculata]
MENQKKVACSENEQLAAYLLNKRQELALSTKGISENMDMTLSKAYSNICNCKTPIKTMKDLYQINYSNSGQNPETRKYAQISHRGVGKWILKQMQGFFQTDSGPSENDEIVKKGNKNKGPKRYVPQKNSVAFALVITLFRGTESGSDFMLKKDLIDAAEISGLSRVPIMPEKGKGKAGQFGSTPRDWYTGWSCMKTLINRGLVVKSSCPAKYMLTDEGKEVAHECLSRSGMIDTNRTLGGSEKDPDINKKDKSRVGMQGELLDLTCDTGPLAEKEAQHNLKKPKISIEIEPEYLDKFTSMGFSRAQVMRAFSEAVETSKNKEMSSIWPTVLCRLREEEIYGSTSISKSIINDNDNALPSIKPTQGFCASENIQPRDSAASSYQKSFHHHNFKQIYSSMKACSSTDNPLKRCRTQGSEAKSHGLALPPLVFGEKFGDVYEVILILDNREQFATQGSRSKKIIDNISSQFHIQIEVRRLPVGDGIWIARHKYLGTEYVLDFIVERKKVDDLRHSIRDNRYRDQKMRLVRCGLKKMIYLVEGDPNSSEAAESIKTACFTTEILEGFDVQRTAGLADTLRKYGYLTQSINQFYMSMDNEEKCVGVCPPFDEFIRRCEELDKLTISDVFAIQLMQVPQVTEDITLAVLDMYPTLFSLAQAYSLLDGDVSGQEEMLKKQSNNLISGAASKNIFHLVWGDSIQIAK